DEFEEKCCQSKAAGLHKCEKCGFEYYKVSLTTKIICPKCSHPLPKSLYPQDGGTTTTTGS
ncbi:MAG TPA: hypothetical protein P5523_08180, partial [Bacteroidales bacterium]|nr:hypothetical protein [Bacteroidales bacterium]